MNDDFVFTSESVTAAHPDKLCDQISDEIVDRLLAEDPASRVVAECAMFGGVVFLATRFATTSRIDLVETARRVLRGAGYAPEDLDADECAVMTSHLGLLPEYYPPVDVAALDEESIARIPAGNQVTVFGFASNQTPSLMPLPIVLAHRLARRLEQVAKDGTLDYLMPDGKSQVAVEYRARRPRRLHSLGLVACLREARRVPEQRIRSDLLETVVEPVFAEEALRPDRSTRLHLNPEGPFLGGGPKVHCGLTGRKTAIDAYGEFARHSGSALSGKDPLRIDRVGAYAARYVANQVVAAGLADDCEVQLSYTVGEAEPISIQLETFNTGRIPDRQIAARIRSHFDLRPAGIVKSLGLQQAAARKGGFYRRLAAYGQVGRQDFEVPWESLGRAGTLLD